MTAQSETVLIEEHGGGDWTVTLSLLEATTTDEDGNTDVPITEVVLAPGLTASPHPFPGGREFGASS